MATTLAASTYAVFATVLGVRYELSITARIGTYARFADNNQAVSPEQLSGMVAHTIATWQRVIEAVMNGSFKVAAFKGEGWPSAEHKQGVVIQQDEPFVTVWNKEWNSKGLGVTVHSWDDGTTALMSAYSMAQGLEKLAPYADKFGIEKLEYAPLPAMKEAPKPAPGSLQRAIDDVDTMLGLEKEAPQDSPDVEKLPFRYFKRIAPAVINLQEFVQGGNGKDKYQKAAIEATLPMHKNAVQYDENALIYYPITGAIQIKEGNYGKQAIIPTAKGRVYVDMQFNGQEKPEWATLSADLHNHYERLLDNDDASLFAPNAVVVLKNSAIKDGKQYRNFYHVYQELK